LNPPSARRSSGNRRRFAQGHEDRRLGGEQLKLLHCTKGLNCAHFLDIHAGIRVHEMVVGWAGIPVKAKLWEFFELSRNRLGLPSAFGSKRDTWSYPFSIQGNDD